MTDTPQYQRDLRGRFARVPVETAYAGDSKFPTVAKEGIDVQFQGSDPRDLAYGTVRRHAPAGDVLAQGGLDWPPGVRTARLVSGGDEREVYATPHNATLNDAVHTGESGRPWAQQSAYSLSDVDETAPGEVAARARFGVQGAHVRAAARRGTDPTTRFITGADDD